MLRRFTMVLCALGFVCLCAGAVSATSYTFYDLGCQWGDDQQSLRDQQQ